MLIEPIWLSLGLGVIKFTSSSLIVTFNALENLTETVIYPLTPIFNIVVKGLLRSADDSDDESMKHSLSKEKNHGKFLQ